MVPTFWVGGAGGRALAKLAGSAGQVVPARDPRSTATDR